ncbi:MAG: hypothetical protein KY445_03595 [Armatimonadetes bacterium]|nr:hypothetical protein [Armatimonadota bacterium]
MSAPSLPTRPSAPFRFARGLWILPLLVTLLAAMLVVPAHAQPTRETVVVLDFDVVATLDPLAGRKAADAFAVELQRSGNYEVVTRQRVEEAIAQQAGLGDPLNDVTQVRLAQALGASTVFTGRVVGIATTPQGASRVRLDLRQLEASTGDYVNGTQVEASADQRTIEIARELLNDEAINKAAYVAVRQLSAPYRRQGSLLNATRNDVELSIGARDGVVNGQRYAVLRDFANRATGVTERRKIGELVIIAVDSNQSTGTLVSGGAVGARTGDRIRQIYDVTVNPSSVLNSRARRTFGSSRKSKSRTGF